LENSLLGGEQKPLFAKEGGYCAYISMSGGQRGATGEKMWVEQQEGGRMRKVTQKVGGHDTSENERVVCLRNLGERKCKESEKFRRLCLKTNRSGDSG